MNKRLKLSCLSLFLALVICSCSSQKKYSYETVPNDPLKARIYTLDNGLKVYLTVNKETPRIQTFIAVRVGGKNDPAETTGLAHYFEHLMFKGTDKFGTKDYAAEKPLLDAIEQQFEIYRKTTNEAERKAIYHTIDSLSYEASKYAIPNEYDKLMAAIGSTGSNAYTWYDQTVYQEDIPSNQIENWAKIQADRFENNVIRGFHTELEAVYEEKNMSLTRDNSKVQEAIFSSLFPKHPYGTQTVLGTQENLKNPSITNIKNYYKQWYVPNNMAICMSGDLDPDETIAMIDKYFGSLKPNPELPKLDLPKEDPITAPIVKEVLGPDAESVALAWRFPGASSKDFEILQVVSQVLYNGQAGLIDLNLNQQQKVLNSYGYPMDGSQPVRSGEVHVAGCIVLVKQSQNGKSSIERLRAGKAMAQLMPQLVIDRWSENARNQAAENLFLLLKEMPVYQLTATMDEQAVACLEKILKMDDICRKR